MSKAKEIFESMPHITEIWVTENGNHHLHPHAGGDKITRDEALGEHPEQAEGGDKITRDEALGEHPEQAEGEKPKHKNK